MPLVYLFPLPSSSRHATDGKRPHTLYMLRPKLVLYRHAGKLSSLSTTLQSDTLVHNLFMYKKRRPSQIDTMFADASSNNEEVTILLEEQNNGGSSSTRRHHHRSKRVKTFQRVVYICGILILFSKIKSRCTPPKAFNLDEYTNSSYSSQTLDKPKTRIPKIIHQSYKSLDTLPKVWASTPSRWKSLHPDYEYKFWSDDDNRNLIQQYYPWFLETYDGYPAPIQRADAARYFAVLHYGGIYADLDILPIRSVDALLEHLDLQQNGEKEMIVAETYNLGLTNALFAAVPNSTVLNQFVHELPMHTKPLHGLEPLIPHFGVLLSTGPTRLWIFLSNHRSKILTLNPAGWGQCHQCKQKQCVPQEGSFFETTKGGSWHKWDTRIMNFIFCHVHFCVWGGICLLMGLYHWYCEQKVGGKQSMSEMEMSSNAVDAAERGGDGDISSSLGVTGKKRRSWRHTSNVFRSAENIVFIVKLIASQHRFPIYCFVIFVLVL